jgi:hypothetical protein
MPKGLHPFEDEVVGATPAALKTTPGRSSAVERVNVFSPLSPFQIRLTGNSAGKSAGLLNRRPRVQIPPCQPTFRPKGFFFAVNACRTTCCGFESRHARLPFRACSSTGRAAVLLNLVAVSFSGECRNDYIHQRLAESGNSGDPKLFMRKPSFQFCHPFFYRSNRNANTCP